MTGQAPQTCAGCTHARKRMKWSKPRTWCARYQKLHEIRCIDYQTKRRSIAAALEYVKRISIK